MCSSVTYFQISFLIILLSGFVIRLDLLNELGSVSSLFSEGFDLFHKIPHYDSLNIFFTSSDIPFLFHIGNFCLLSVLFGLCDYFLDSFSYFFPFNWAFHILSFWFYWLSLLVVFSFIFYSTFLFPFFIYLGFNMIFL